MLRRKRLISLACLLLATLAGAGWAQEVSGPVTGDTTWRGKITLVGPVEVPPGAVLRIAAGTEVGANDPGIKMLVRGRLLVEGSGGDPVIFNPPEGWQGIELMEPSGESLLSHARFQGAATGVAAFDARFTVRDCEFHGGGVALALMRETQVLVENSFFADNRVGIDARMKSQMMIRGSTFRGQKKSALVASHGSGGEILGNTFENNQQAVGLKGRYAGRIEGNVFRGNSTGIFCNQSQRSPEILTNLFEANDNALVNLSFSYSIVRNNRFEENRTAIYNDQFGSATIERNLFRGNGTALHNNRKSDPMVEKNVFAGNELALFCDYSSYPKVRANNFTGNPMAVKLGIYQSADFEAREGSKGIVMQQAQARMSRNPLLDKAPTEFRDVVDVSGNWWGAETTALAAAGAEGNLPFFHDRLDQPKVTYEGWGEQEFALDRVVFAPWLEAAVADAGPEVGT